MELRHFLECVNYYHDMWPSGANVLKTLTDQSGLNKGAPLMWTDAQQASFEKMCHLMADDALAAYPDHIKWFDLYIDTFNFQVGLLHHTRRQTPCLLQA
jgi:hypothetical protein